MDNYVYIISSLPVISQDWESQAQLDTDGLIEEIISQCSGSDKTTIAMLMDGFKDENLNPDFYRKATAHSNSFLRNYFTFDLAVRNTKVRFINKALGRPEDQDVILLNEEEDEFEESAALEAVLNNSDILSRERGIDNLMWKKIDELTTFNYFDLDAILGFISKLHIIDRWLKLDEKTGRELFHRLVSEVRSTFKGVEYQ